MRYLIGIDEAGYGPNLGPLVVAATVFRVADPAAIPQDPRTALPDLYRALRPAVRRRLPRADKHGARRVVWADSKLVYSPADGLARLELGVLAALAAVCDDLPQCLDSLRAKVAGWSGAAEDESSLCQDADPVAVPLAADREALASAATSVRRALANQGVELIDIRARVVEPACFNRLVREHGNKASALTAVSVGLLASVLADESRRPTLAVCDKHGGRNLYQPALQRQFDEWLVEVLEEGRAQSRYRFGPREQCVEARFRVRGESFLPTALASMTAKYLRELAMTSFNRFWARRVEGLRPTAGYPGDSRRFKADIAAAQAALGISDEALWRSR